MEKRFLRLNDIGAYKVAFELSNYVWEVVLKWDVLAKKTVGDQFIRAVDSISANIAEGFGRYHKKDKVRFYRIAYGSITESLDWNEKGKRRNLLTKTEYEHIYNQLMKLPKELNALIRFTNEKLSI